MKTARKAWLSSLVALLVCISMLVGTTFAWFTDTVASNGNIIKSGTLHAEMKYGDKIDAINEDASTGSIFKYNYWEPGFVDIKYVKVINTGSLAFRFQLSVIPDGDLTAGGVNLADVIDVYMIPTDKTISREDLGSTYKPVGTLTELMNNPDGYARGVVLSENTLANVTLNDADKNTAKTGSATYCIALKMQESATNEYQNKNVGGTFRVQLLATQYTYENDSLGNDYDTDAQLPGSWKGTAPVSVTNGEVTEAVSIGTDAEPYSAAVPAGVKMADGAEELALSIELLRVSEADITLEGGETATSLDIHMEGLSEDNDKPVLITLKGLMKKGLNSTSVAMYHVEDGVTVPMTLVTTPVNHNEFSYDPATGDVVMAVASFSEYVAVTDNNNPWEGTRKTDWYNDNDKEFTLTTAEQLAGFGVLVDNGNTFAGKTVKLGADINLNGQLFDPIGWGYDYADYNVDDVEGKTFKGTFDGGNHTIYGLYQNGWDLESQTETDYTYTNCGGGLFASATDATIQNLTISGANIVMECVEIGILVGLSQGNCTYKNINICDSKIANYQRPAGGVVGEVSPKYEDGVWSGTQIFEGVTVGADVVVGSLWGDFDAPVGGVIGARWDDYNVTTVEMTNCDVACKLDVYNDVTSTYQWYAYRRAGMLIGNTDTPPANGKDSDVATADFLECSNVVVRYGPWVNYHYCQFTNYNSSWPWVRVEAGENCSAYSNPRYGVPNDNDGNMVVDANHVHAEDDTCMELIPFNQLYGGGQGVYGAETHNGVTVEHYLYSVTYINNSKVLDVKYVMVSDLAEDGTFATANAEAEAAAEESMNALNDGNTYAFDHWMNAGSTKIDKVPAGNTEDIVLYPSFVGVYTAIFVDQNGNILAWDTFTENNHGNITALGNETTPPAITDDYTFDYWEVHVTDTDGNTTQKTALDEYSFGKTDITIYPVYKYNGDVSLIPVDNDGDGVTDEYQVGGYGAETGQQELVEIPGVVNGVPVTTINADAFSSYDDLHSVRIPGTITVINSQAFTADDTEQWGTQRDTVTLYYEGDPAVWKTAMEKYNADDYSGMLKEKWDNAMGEGSRVFFLDEYGKVDLTQGYWELSARGFIYETFTWNYHDHAFPYDSTNHTCDYDHNQNDTVYDAATRPDAAYWTTETTTTE